MTNLANSARKDYAWILHWYFESQLEVTMNEESGLGRRLSGMIPFGLQINRTYDSGLTSEPVCNVFEMILYAEHPVQRL